MAKKLINIYFPKYLEEFLRDREIKYLGDLTDELLDEYFCEYNILYKDAKEYLKYYHEILLKKYDYDNIIIEYDHHAELVKNSLFDLDTNSINESFLVENVENVYLDKQLDLVGFNDKVKKINSVNYELNILKICPKKLSDFLESVSLTYVKDLVDKFTFIDYMAIDNEDYEEFNKFLDSLKYDMVSFLQKEFINLLTFDDTRIIDVLEYRVLKKTYVYIGRKMSYSDVWVRQLDLTAIEHFKKYIIASDFRLYRLCKDYGLINFVLVDKYFGKYSEIFKYLYKNKDLEY